MHATQEPGCEKAKSRGQKQYGEGSKEEVKREMKIDDGKDTKKVSV